VNAEGERNNTNHPKAPSEHSAVMDQLLSPYLQAVTEEESEQILAHLIGQQLIPVVKEIVSYKLRFSGAARFADEQQREDVCQDALMRLLPQIRQCRLPSQPSVIEDLQSLTAVIARRSCFDYLRRKYPRRHSRLKP
jgi:DNA-directed RNA polymerase specialized sigma24 family protein